LAARRPSIFRAGGESVSSSGGFCFLADAIALALACDSTPTTPSVCVSNGSLSAQIDGTAWSASCVL
jgi:hypothetical protein